MDGFCYWCADLPVTWPGYTPPPPGANASTSTSSGAGNPNPQWTYADYMQDNRFKQFLQDLTDAEIMLFQINPKWIPFAMTNKRDAESKTAQLFANPQMDNGNANAFKHAYWSKLNQLSFGASNAKLIGDAHEYGDPRPNCVAMDNHNNQLGIDTPGMLEGWPPPGYPKQLYFQYTIILYINGGWARRLQDGQDSGALIPTNGDGRK